MKKNKIKVNLIDLYEYKTFWSEEDSMFIGLCSEFSSLSCLESSQEKALKEVRSLVENIVIDMTKKKEKLPEPIHQKQFSGKLVLRLPKSKHKELVIKADDEGVSLNQYILSKLAN